MWFIEAVKRQKKNVSKWTHGSFSGNKIAEMISEVWVAK